MAKSKVGVKPIRSVEELETRRVDLSLEIESLLATGKDRGNLDRVIALRKEQAGLLDELALSKNIEAGKKKEELLHRLEVSQTESQDAYDKILQLANGVLPKLRELEPVFIEMVRANIRLGGANSQTETAKRALGAEYGEVVEISTKGIGLIYQVSPSVIRDVIQRLEGMLGIETIIPKVYREYWSGVKEE